MKILVANLGSTSFKYTVFAMGEGREAELARGGYQGVGDFERAIADCLAELREAGAIGSGGDIDGVGFKAVLGHGLSGCVEADERVLEALEAFADVSPAHNPAYAAGIRQFARALPSARRVALFETAFHQWQSEGAANYAVPEAWREAGLRRHGFHGASHKGVAERSAELMGRSDVAEACRRLYADGPKPVEGEPLRVVSCHLGGSSSVCGIRNGVSIGASMGFSPQSGLPQNNRVGDLDSMAVFFAQRRLGLSLEEIEKALTRESGLRGLSGTSNDFREVQAAADKGDPKAALAIDVIVHQIRHWIGAYMLELGGMDALCFTGGIGEHQSGLRERVCRGLEGFGLKLDEAANREVSGSEGQVHAADSRVRVFVIAANEELVVARETRRLIEGRN